MNSRADTLTRSSRDRIAGVRCPNESTVRRTAQVGQLRFDAKQEDGRTPATVARQSSGHPCCFLLSEASSPSPARAAGTVATGSVLTPTPYVSSITSRTVKAAAHTAPHGDSRGGAQSSVQLGRPRRIRRRGPDCAQAAHTGNLSAHGLRERREHVAEHSVAEHGDSRRAASTGEHGAWPSPRATSRSPRAGINPARTLCAFGDRGTVARSWSAAARREGGPRP